MNALGSWLPSGKSTLQGCSIQSLTIQNLSGRSATTKSRRILRVVVASEMALCLVAGVVFAAGWPVTKDIPGLYESSATVVCSKLELTKHKGLELRSHRRSTS